MMGGWLGDVVAWLGLTAPFGQRLLWKKRTGGGWINDTVVWSSPLHLGDCVYIASRDGYLYALDEHSGRQHFRADTHGYVDSSPQASRDGRSVLIGLSGKRGMGAFSALDGKEEWSKELAECPPCFVDSTPRVSPDGRTVAIGDDAGATHLLEAATGRIVWSTEHGPPEYSSPIFSKGGETIFTGIGGLSGGGWLAARDAADGSIRWRTAIVGPIQSVPRLSADGTAVFFGSWDGSVHALRTVDGSRLWSHKTGDKVDASVRLSPDGKTAYVGSWDGCLYALGAADGRLRWRSCTGGNVRSSAAPSADGRAVFVGSGDGHLYAFHASDGSLWWREYCGTALDDAKMDYGVRSSPVISRNGSVIYVGSADGHTYAFRTGL